MSGEITKREGIREELARFDGNCGLDPPTIDIETRFRLMVERKRG